MSNEELAKSAIELYSKISKLQKELDEKKDQLREASNGETTSIIVDGFGKVSISKPRKGSEKTILSIDEDVLSKVSGLKDTLIKKGVLKEEIKITPPARANVSISCNV